MKPVSPELLTLLSTRVFFAVDLYTFELIDGSVVRYCGGDQDIWANGFHYPAGGQTGPYFDRKDNKAKITWQTGVQACTLVFDVIPGSAEINGEAFLDTVRKGNFDGATVTLERVFMPTYGDTRRGTVIYFVGRVAEIDSGRSIATFSVNSHTELMNLTLPRNVYQPGCVNSLGDAACLATIPSSTGVVTSGSTQGVVNASSIANGSGSEFNLGKITFSSGILNGQSFSVHTVTFGSPIVISIVGFLPTAPSAGDTFTIYYGCDKTFGQPVSTTGNTDGVSAAITNLGSIAGLVANMIISGPGVVPGTYTTGVASSSVTTNNIIPAQTGGTFVFSSSDGCPKFNNLIHFRGFPFIPQPSTAA